MKETRAQKHTVINMKQCSHRHQADAHLILIQAQHVGHSLSHETKCDG